MVIDQIVNQILCSSYGASLPTVCYCFKTLRIQDCMLTMKLRGETLTLEVINGNTKVTNLPNLRDLSDTTNDLVEDLNNLLDGVLQNQLQVFAKQTQRNQIAVQDEHFSSSVDELQNDVSEDDQARKQDLSFISNRKCFVKLVKLPDKLVHAFMLINAKKSDEKCFKCNKCDYSSARRTHLTRHLKIHSSERPFACHHCDYRGRCKRHLKEHMTIHLLPYKCDLCSYQSKRKEHLKNHLFTHSLTRKRTFCCELCSYKGFTADSLRQHMKLIHHDKQFICNVCERDFSCKTSLTDHMWMHAGEKPFGCNICQFTTIYKSNLHAHMISHTENYLKCNLCKYRTFHKSNLKRHVLIHSEEKSFVCNVCEHQTASKERLKEHIRTHTGEKPFSCKLCKTSFGSRTNLRRHVKLHDKKQRN